MDNDAGGSDTIASSVAESVALSTARLHEVASDIADSMTMPTSPDVDSTVLGSLSG